MTTFIDLEYRLKGLFVDLESIGCNKGKILASSMTYNENFAQLMYWMPCLRSACCATERMKAVCAEIESIENKLKACL